MAKKYDPNKARQRQQKRASNVAESNFGDNVLGNLTREFKIPKVYADNSIYKIPVRELYAAPYCKDWNNFKKLSPDKAYELHQSIIDGGLLTPIIVWKIDKNVLQDIYKDNLDEYGFLGSEYMILSGHSRAYAFSVLHHYTKDDYFLKIDSIVRENLSYEEAQYIIKVTNFVTRELSRKEKRENIKFMHRVLEENKTKGMNVAKKIAEDTDSALRTVRYEMAISNKLIEPFIEMYDNEEITQGNAIKLTRLTPSMQKWLHNAHKDDITNDILKNLQKYHRTKEDIEKLFHPEEKSMEYVNITIEVPSIFEKKFRTMASKWVSKELKKEEEKRSKNSPLTGL